MEEGEADLEPGCDCETPPARDLGLPDLSGVPVGSPPPGPSDGFLGRAETQIQFELNLSPGIEES